MNAIIVDQCRGLLQCVIYLCALFESIFPDELDLVSGPFRDSFVPQGQPDSPWRSDIDQLTSDVHPFMCHSHNDYWRREPLYQAIHAGCTGVEADVWLLNEQRVRLRLDQAQQELDLIAAQRRDAESDSGAGRVRRASDH